MAIDCIRTVTGRCLENLLPSRLLLLSWRSDRVAQGVYFIRRPPADGRGGIRTAGLGFAEVSGRHAIENADEVNPATAMTGERAQGGREACAFRDCGVTIL